ncbi:LysM peptidoglycan-binding domain-containing protein [Bacillus velezensis]|uniref:LysM peptidoglycan-binding domain-containing protein n=1 Tax=Bacillus velezensis TaxID=492670 RepID=UPI001E535413|nr:LysM peptidoglycan-binding domain-containing protein [Bacillus velezensis]MCD7910996.1 LysM peptidoglycan-binding domain-containing protein [Bacillus velezensis]
MTGIVIALKKKPLWKRINWVNLMTVFMLAAAIAVFLFWFINLHNYQIDYIKYEVRKNDSLIEIVQQQNDYAPWGWDSRDFVDLTIEKNQITNPSTIQPGDVLLIPVAKKKGH